MKKFIERRHVAADFFTELKKLLQSRVQQLLAVVVVLFERVGGGDHAPKLVLVLIENGNGWFFLNGFAHWMLAMISSTFLQSSRAGLKKLQRVSRTRILRLFNAFHEISARRLHAIHHRRIRQDRAFTAPEANLCIP
ncbi:hypothetical protein D3C78_1089690 [compost metagenome]